MNPSTGNFENPRLMENIQATTFYGFDIDEDGNILNKDANGYVNSGSVKVFDEMGVFQYEFTTGINPNTVIKIK